jgi:hypothetical protein
MTVGNRAQSYHRSKHCIARHNLGWSGGKRMANALEKVEKTRIRRDGKRACLQETW